MDFDLNRAIAEWRKEILQRKGMQPGTLAELESGLHDRYDDYLLRGYAPAEAFSLAREKLTPKERTASLGFLLPNYLKVATRNLRRRAFYNVSNFLCLTIGIFCAVLAVLYLNYENSFDAFVPEVGSKYRIGQQYRSQGYSMLAFPEYFDTEAEAQRRHIAAIGETKGVAQACQFFVFDAPTLVEIANKELPTEYLLQTNTPEAFFDFFGFSFLIGDAMAFGGRPNTAVLTETEAQRFFGENWRSQEVVGQILTVEGEEYEIVGVMQDVPPNCHFDFRVAFHRDRIDYWGARVYVQLAKEEDPDAFRDRLAANFSSVNNRLVEDELFLGPIVQPLRSLHLNSDLLYEMKPPGDKRYLYIIGIIAAIILLLTISNYTNLSIAMNAGRAREIGMRKLFGASEGQVASQFMLESVVLGVLTLPVVGLAVYLLLPAFNRLMGAGIRENLVLNPLGWLFLLGVAAAVGILAGLYPAFFLARRPVLKLFRGNVVKNNFKGFSTRKAIVTFQFALLIGLCSLTLFVNRQLAFMQEKDLGFGEDNILYVSLSEDSTQFISFRDELLRLPQVTGVGSGSTFGGEPFNQTTYQLEGTEAVFDDAYTLYLDYAALQLLDIETSIPQYVERPDEAPRQLRLVNETLVERLSNRFDLSREELIGQTVVEEPEYTNPESGEVGFPFVIAGTFNDLNIFSLRERMTPMFMTVYKEPRFVYDVIVKYRNAKPNEIVDLVKERYEAVLPGKAFVYSFLTENLEELYEQERRIARLSIYFSVIAFLVAVIGLVGLTAFLTTLKRKEIGIRKVLGASNYDILLRFNREYLALILVALLVAVPLTYYGVSRWLAGFAYRTGISGGVFLLAGFITLFLTVVAVSLVTLRTARRVPVEALQANQ